MGKVKSVMPFIIQEGAQEDLVLGNELIGSAHTELNVDLLWGLINLLNAPENILV